jgi:hypothetical protein
MEFQKTFMKMKSFHFVMAANCRLLAPAALADNVTVTTLASVGRVTPCAPFVGQSMPRRAEDCPPYLTTDNLFTKPN